MICDRILFMEESPSVSQLLIAWGRGEPAALEQLTPRVYGELHKLARFRNPGHKEAIRDDNAGLSLGAPTVVLAQAGLAAG